ncbi:MAG: YraN family protein [Lachnospiraceae bacterium]|nr:YraN family protein [Lachnospiraceae bacterium]
MNKRQVGSKKEDEAAAFLEKQGLTVLEKNFRCRLGEIDLIASDGDYTVFVEVKYRKTASSGHPEEAVGISKARTISKTADYYRLIRKLPYDANIRFDVVAIEGDEIRWHKNAFPYSL